MLLIPNNDPGLMNLTITDYRPDGTQVLASGYELSKMSDEERWDWANQWITQWPNGRRKLLGRLNCLNAWARDACTTLENDADRRQPRSD